MTDSECSSHDSSDSLNNDNESDYRGPIFFDISIGNKHLGRLTIELDYENLPITAENFRQFCTGEYRVSGISQGYKNSFLHRLVNDHFIQGGDFLSNDGTGSHTIFGTDFMEEENLSRPIELAGTVGMSNNGQCTTGSQFFITLNQTPMPWLNYRYVIVGQCVGEESGRILTALNQITTDGDDKPRTKVKISNCGEL